MHHKFAVIPSPNVNQFQRDSLDKHNESNNIRKKKKKSFQSCSNGGEKVI